MSLLDVKLKNHKEWRKLAKKLRRKKIRQKLAKELELEENKKLCDPEYQRIIKENEAAELIQRHTNDLLHQEAEEKWMRDDLLAQKRFNDEKRKKELIQTEKEENHLRIQQELRKQRQIQRERLEDLKKQEEKRIEKQKHLLEHMKYYVDGKITSLTEDLTESANTNPGKNNCKFFSKTAACRYGDKCISNHCRPGISNIILIRNFYKHVLLNQINHNEYCNTDMALEYSNTDLNEDYNKFYNDVVPEIEKIGEIINFRVCCNYDLHLSGNVYIEFKTEREAMRAYLNLQGRYYAEKQLNVEFCAIPSWKVAVCGLANSNRCLKGSYCNFLHLFKNPGNKYNKPLNFENLEIKYKSTERPALLSWEDVNKRGEREDWSWSDNEDSMQTSESQNAIRKRKSSEDSIRHKVKKTKKEKIHSTDNESDSKNKKKKQKKDKTSKKEKKKKTQEIKIK